MKALTVEPGRVGSLTAEVVAEPEADSHDLLVEGLAVGICGTDREIVSGSHGVPPPGRDRMVIGHESLGRVIAAAPGSGFAAGDLVTGVVRRPDPVPCGACAHGEFDMCRNGRYRERGIKELDGYASQRWVVDADYAVPVDSRLADVGVLLEPASVVAKAWQQVDRIGARAWSEPRSVLVTGAGPIGLLAALLGAQRGLDVHVLDRVVSGPKPDLVTELGGTYHHKGIDDIAERLEPDIVIEATGAGPLVLDAMTITGPYGIVCLTGVSPGGRRLTTDPSELNREIVLENDAIVGSVNANLSHFRSAADALARADQNWLSGLISRRVPLGRFEEAFDKRDDDVKTVISLV